MASVGGGRPSGGAVGEDPKFQRWLNNMAEEQLAEEAGGGRSQGEQRRHTNEWYAGMYAEPACPAPNSSREPGSRRQQQSQLQDI